jgi:hypothetical protein
LRSTPSSPIPAAQGFYLHNRGSLFRGRKHPSFWCSCQAEFGERFHNDVFAALNAPTN